MVDAKKQGTEQPANDQLIAEGDAEQVVSTHQNYLLPDANNGQGRAVKARSLTEAIAKAEKLDKDNEGSK